MTVILTERLTKRYGQRLGVDGLELNIPEGSLFGFLGPNGSGKTTTIRALLGLLKPSGGAVRVFGQDPWRHGHRIKAEVGYVPGDLRLYPWLTCRSALRIFGWTRKRDLAIVGCELAEEFSLEMDVPVRLMSRGMRQKLGLILALAHRPRLLILDEPSSGLDPLIQDLLFRRLRALATEGHTVFFSSHTLSEVEMLCDHVAILRAGRLVENAPLESLRRRAQRLVQIAWRAGTDGDRIAPPSCLTVAERQPQRWRASLTGSAAELVRWCAEQPVEDVSIGQPDLASLFRQYYAGTT